MYWAEARLHPSIIGFSQRLKRLNANWDVTILGPSHSLIAQGTLKPPPVDFEKNGDSTASAHTADWYRLQVILLFGGVWLDATTIAMNPIESWIDIHSDAVVQGFLVPGEPEDGKTEQMENWAFAAPAQSPFIERWAQEYEHALLSGTAYLASDSIKGYIAASSYLSSQTRLMLAYLLQHVAWCVVRMRDFPHAPVLLASSLSVTFNGTSWPGPFGIQSMCTWDVGCTLHKVFLELPRSTYDHTPFVKFRGDERKAMRPLAEYAAQGSWLGEELQSDLEAYEKWDGTWSALSTASTNPVPEWVWWVLGCSLGGAAVALATWLWCCWRKQSPEKQKSESSPLMLGK